MTKRAGGVIRELLALRQAPKGVGLKLLRQESDELGMVLSTAEGGDVTLPDAEEPLLIVDRSLVHMVHESILDATIDAEGNPQFCLRHISHSRN
jgi:hypothetical protein